MASKIEIVGNQALGIDGISGSPHKIQHDMPLRVTIFKGDVFVTYEAVQVLVFDDTSYLAEEPVPTERQAQGHLK